MTDLDNLSALTSDEFIVNEETCVFNQDENSQTVIVFSQWPTSREFGAFDSGSFSEVEVNRGCGHDCSVDLKDSKVKSN